MVAGDSLLQLSQRLHGLLHGRLPVQTVYIIQIDVIDAQTSEAPLAGLHDVLRRAVDGHIKASVGPGREREAAFRREHNVPPALGVQLEPRREKVLVVAVDVAGVPVRAAELPGTVEQRETLGVGAEENG